MFCLVLWSLLFGIIFWLLGVRFEFLRAKFKSNISWLTQFPFWSGPSGASALHSWICKVCGQEVCDSCSSSRPALTRLKKVLMQEPNRTRVCAGYCEEAGVGEFAPPTYGQRSAQESSGSSSSRTPWFPFESRAERRMRLDRSPRGHLSRNLF